MIIRRIEDIARYCVTVRWTSGQRQVECHTLTDARRRARSIWDAAHDGRLCHDGDPVDIQITDPSGRTWTATQPYGRGMLWRRG